MPGQAANARALASLGLPEDVVPLVLGGNAVRVYAGLDPAWVAVDWTLDLILPPDIVQLKTERSAGIRREHFEAGEVIFREGERGDRLYIVTEGEVEVRRHVAGAGSVALRRLGAGECFGEIALVSESPRTATVQCTSPTNVIAVDREAFHALFSTLPPLRGFFEQMIAKRLEPTA